MQDITERKQHEAELEKFKAIIESSDDAIISKSLKSIITSWNRGAEQIFGYTAAEAIGKPMQMLFPPERLLEESELIARISRGERIDHFETVRRHKDVNADIRLLAEPHIFWSIVHPLGECYGEA